MYKQRIIAGLRENVNITVAPACTEGGARRMRRHELIRPALLNKRRLTKTPIWSHPVFQAAETLLCR